MSAPDIEFFLNLKIKAPFCWQLVLYYYATIYCDVDTTGIDTTDKASIQNTFVKSLLRQNLKKVYLPTDDCLVLMYNCFDSEVPDHAGVYIEKGVLHASTYRPRFDDIYSIGDDFKKIEYYDVTGVFCANKNI